MPLDFAHAAIAFLAAFVAGSMNSVAGGGTLVSFPALIWLGLPSVTANATNTVMIWPGSLGAMWGYRRELRSTETRLLALVAPSLAGGVAGAWLLRRTPTQIFDALVPLLILAATMMFMAQETVQRKLRTAHVTAQPSYRWLAGAMLFQLLVGLYGGYFGAGIGILMLAALNFLGLTEIHQMNGLKNFFALCINGVAALYFVLAKMVYWPDVIIMATGAVSGGYIGAGVARRLGGPTVRRIVIAIGFGMTLSLLVKFFIK